MPQHILLIIIVLISRTAIRVVRRGRRANLALVPLDFGHWKKQHIAGYLSVEALAKAESLRLPIF